MTTENPCDDDYWLDWYGSVKHDPISPEPTEPRECELCWICGELGKHTVSSGGRCFCEKCDVEWNMNEKPIHYIDKPAPPGYVDSA